MRFTSAPPPHATRQKLAELINLALKLHKEYEEAYDDGYLGVRTRFEVADDADAKGKESGSRSGKGNHRDPVGDIVCDKLHTGIRRNTTNAANKISDAFYALTQAQAELDAYKRGYNK